MHRQQKSGLSHTVLDDGGQTPRQTEPMGDMSPAWNPHDRDPVTLDDAIASSQCSTSRQNYWVLNERLVGIPMRVYIDGIQAKGKDIEVLPENFDGKICITKKKQRSREIIEPDRITAVHPGVRDYDRWVIISGDHCGKHVHAFQFRRFEGHIQWHVFVVELRDGDMDHATEEHLHVFTEDICLMAESLQSKRLNKPLAERWKGSWDKWILADNEPIISMVQLRPDVNY